MNARTQSPQCARSASGLLALVLAIASAAGAAPGVPADLPGLSRDEVRKLDPELIRAFAATTAAARGNAGAEAAAPWLAIAGAAATDHGPVCDVLIRLTDRDASRGASALANQDLAIDAVVGSIITLPRVPVARLADLARDPAIAQIQPSRTYHTMNDVSVPETGAPQVWQQYGTTGTGIIVAIIDTGIDPDHVDFQHPNGTTRILRLLDLANAGSGPYGGTLSNSQQIDAGVKTSDPVGHGTHVAGTAAGAGNADQAFRGVAPDADLIIVNASRAGNGSFSSSDIVNALSFVDQQAAALQKPWVANLSLGGHAGAHDGTELEEVAIDNLVGQGKPGKSVVIAAGNDRSSEPRHAHANVNAGGLTLTLSVPSYTPQQGNGNDLAVVNIWYENSSDFRISLESPSHILFGPVNAGEWNGENGELTDDGLVGIANALGGPTPPAPGAWKIRFEGDTGPFDAYVAQSSFEGQFTSYAVAGGFVAEPGTSRNAITVGAYMTKLAWTDKDGHTHDLRLLGYPNAEVGQLAVFSNVGPTRDGRIKPEIAAPGQEIASCYTPDADPSGPVSAYRTPLPQFPNFFLLAGDHYAIEQGTSQAAPHVTGAVALLLDRHPGWDQYDLRRSLTGSARADAYTGAVPNDLFGFGKLDVFAAVQDAKTPGVPPPGDVSGDLTTDLNDAQLAINYILGLDTPSGEQEERADMNRDHRLDVGDVVLIIRVVLAGTLTGPENPEHELRGEAEWLVPIAVVPETKGVAITGVDLAISAPPAIATGSVRAGGDDILALSGAGNRPGLSRLMALATDGRDLAQRSAVFFVPVTGDANGKRWDVQSLTLLASNGKHVQGTIEIGTPVRAVPPAAQLRIAALAPEPGRGERTIVLDVPKAAPAVTVAVYDAAGRHVATLVQHPLTAGRHLVTWDGRGAAGPAAAGVYWVRATAGNEMTSARLTVLK
jgi:subtilisin family serine protease